jgi:hypothetical protein
MGFSKAFADGVQALTKKHIDPTKKMPNLDTFLVSVNEADTINTELGKVHDELVKVHAEFVKVHDLLDELRRRKHALIDRFKHCGETIGHTLPDYDKALEEYQEMANESKDADIDKACIQIRMGLNQIQTFTRLDNKVYMKEV